MRHLGNSRIRQFAWYSRSRVFSGPAGIESRYGFHPYTDPDKPAVFFGMRQPAALKAARGHRSDGVVLWQGIDSRDFVAMLDRRRFLMQPRFHHMARSRWNEEDFKSIGLAYRRLNVPARDPRDLRPVKLGSMVHVYMPTRRAQVYEPALVKAVECLCPGIKFCYNREVRLNRRQMRDQYTRCFAGLRMTPHDGMPNTVTELSMMGRHSVFNGDTPGSVRWETIEDAATSIRRLHREAQADADPDHDLSAAIMDWLHFDDDWTYMDYWK